MYSVTKTYGHELGLSVAYRNWKAQTHCRFIHGYALAFSFVFTAETLNENGWVLDFGALGPLKRRLVESFDHTTFVEQGDPSLGMLRELQLQRAVDLRITNRMPGCETFAELAYKYATEFLFVSFQLDRVQCSSVTVSEHGANSATYTV